MPLPFASGGTFLSGNATITGTVTAGGQFLAAPGSAGLPSYAFAGDPDTGLYNNSANQWRIICGAVSVATFTNTPAILALAPLSVGPGAIAGGTVTLTVTPPAHTAVTAEVKDVTVAAHTMTITGSYATQRFTHFGIPTVSAATALTIVTAATVTIEGAPAVTGAGPAAITNPLAFWVQAGDVEIDSAVALGLGAAPTFGTIGATGPAAAGQNEWLRIRTQNGVRFIPVWA